eukprot:CAMPEP_0184378446 /NCGR_PEP_ID=MMETSP0007-20130409/3088_1 /TAXON_ID=97485 /ORGANISM="Prymnesium parvum, Strain Texoma1" /LENGTH=111 /DNA_ID=CAMNT_0026722747 /DNA_START=532 /DNA_END=865 /DNA_ORIENTATION=+
MWCPVNERVISWCFEVSLKKGVTPAPTSVSSPLSTAWCGGSPRPHHAPPRCILLDAVPLASPLTAAEVLQCDDLLDEMTNDELYLNAEYIKSRDTVNKLCQLAGVPAELGD